MSAHLHVPQKATVLVIGAGPSGSYAATVLKREGLDVVLFEAAKFPRYHIGESMLPSIRYYLKYIGCLEKFKEHGFTDKPGAAFKLRQDLKEAWTDFGAMGPDMTAWNVVRSEADEILLRHAESEGVKVFESTRVESIQFSGDPATSRPVSASWTSKSAAAADSENTGTIAFDWLIDASGRAGIMSTKYLKNRHFREHLRNVAVWGYFKNVKVYKEGTRMANSPWFEAMSDGSGWSWLIPLHDGTASIGVVMHDETSKRKKAEHTGNSPSLTEHFKAQLKFLPGVQDFLSDGGHLIEGTVKGSSDYSYFASKYSGDHFRLVGDAASFVDPFFSSGIHIGMTGALSAALTICASLKGQIEERKAQLWHDAKIGISHTRFLFIVLGAYRQMEHQNLAVLSDVSEDNFDDAFKLFQPVIGGFADTEVGLTNEKLESMLDFCAKAFDPYVGAESIMAVHKRYSKEYMSIHGQVLGGQTIRELTDGDEEANRTLTKMNSLKILRSEIDFSDIDFGWDGLNYAAMIERGNLGFAKANANGNGPVTEIVES